MRTKFIKVQLSGSDAYRKLLDLLQEVQTFRKFSLKKDEGGNMVVPDTQFTVMIDMEISPDLAFVTLNGDGVRFNTETQRLEIIGGLQVRSFFEKMLLSEQKGVADIEYNPFINAFLIYTTKYAKYVYDTEESKVMSLLFSNYYKMMKFYFDTKFSGDSVAKNNLKLYTGFSKEEKLYIQVYYDVPFLIIDDNDISYDLVSALDNHPLGLGAKKVTSIYDIYGKLATKKERSASKKDINLNRTCMVYVPVKNIMEYMGYESMNDIKIMDVMEQFFVDCGFMASDTYKPKKFIKYTDDYKIERYRLNA